MKIDFRRHVDLHYLVLKTNSLSFLKYYYFSICFILRHILCNYQGWLGRAYPNIQNYKNTQFHLRESNSSIDQLLIPINSIRLRINLHTCTDNWTRIPYRKWWSIFDLPYRMYVSDLHIIVHGHCGCCGLRLPKKNSIDHIATREHCPQGNHTQFVIYDWMERGTQRWRWHLPKKMQGAQLSSGNCLCETWNTYIDSALLPAPLNPARSAVKSIDTGADFIVHHDLITRTRTSSQGGLPAARSATTIAHTITCPKSSVLFSACVLRAHRHAHTQRDAVCIKKLWKSWKRTALLVGTQRRSNARDGYLSVCAHEDEHRGARNCEA